MVQIIDNFLPEETFRHIQERMMSNDFPWFYGDGVVHPGDGLYQFYHYFLYADHDDGMRPLFPLIEPCVKALGATKLRRIKANLNPKTIFHRGSQFHTDDREVSLTSVFYINTNNGWTKMKDGCKVKCVENRMLIFDSSKEHCGFTCTNEQRKVVVNFNYGTN
tara:strand:+ start:233 stop:721 length:489 start_codon:yes stop_codon:yes gene_type:complete